MGCLSTDVRACERVVRLVECAPACVSERVYAHMCMCVCLRSLSVQV